MLYISHLVADMRGSVGGITYSRNRYGLTGRARAIPVNPTSIFQEVLRGLFGQAVYGWKNLDEAERIAWNNFSKGTPWKNKLGQDVFLTGQAMYIAQRAAAIAGNPANDPSNFDACPCTPGLLPVPAVNFNCCPNPDVGTVVSVTNLHATDNMDFVIRISPPQHLSRNYWTGWYDPYQTVLLEAIAPDSADSASFCPLCLGRYFFEIRGFSAVARNNMTSIVRGQHDVCTLPA